MMTEYKVKVALYVDASNELEAKELVREQLDIEEPESLEIEVEQ